MSWLFDPKTTTVGTGGTTISGSSPFESFLTAAIPGLVSGGLGFLGANYTASQNKDVTKQNQEWQSAEAEKTRNFEQLLANQKIAAEQAMAAANAEVQKQAILQRAYEAAMSGTLQGGQLKMNALDSFLKGVQAPYLRK